MSVSLSLSFNEAFKTDRELDLMVCYKGMLIKAINLLCKLKKI